MKKKLLFLIALGIFTTAYSLETFKKQTNLIINTWIWEKSIGGENNPYTSTPETIGFNKKIVFTPDGKVITYKNDVEIRNSTYEITRGISVFDQLVHDLVTFEGKTYIIEKVDNQNLTLLSNDSEGTRTIYKN
jgi:hypothetical protein